MANLLQQAGSQGDKPPKFAPIYMGRMFSGLWLQRSPLRDPGTRVESLYYGGRPEALIAGVNVELTNLLTLARRPGTSAYSLQTVSEGINSFYSFKTFTTLTETIQVIADGLTKIYAVTPAAITTIYTKSHGAGEASFLGINNTLYIGDGIDQRAWGGSGATRNWGIAAGGLTLTSAYAGTGAAPSSPGGPGSQGPNTGTPADSGIPGPSGSEAWRSGGAGIEANLNVSEFGPTNFDGSNYLEVTPQFPFNVPAGATITGIAVTLDKEAAFFLGTGTVSDNGVFLIKAGVIETGWTDHSSGAFWPGGFSSTSSYGSSSDLWGSGGLTPSDVNASNFGVAIAVEGTADTFEPHSETFFASAIISNPTITVYYTTPVLPDWSNPTRVQGAPDGSYATATPTNDTQTNPLFATNYGFSLTGTVTGIIVNITGHVSAGDTDTILYVQLQDNNGNAVGAQKSVNITSTGDVNIGFGTSTDLWGANPNLTMVNSSNFGVQIIVSGNGETFSIDAAQINIYTGAISVTVSGSSGTFSATTGYKYAYAYANSNISPSVFSNASAISASTGAFSNKLNVAVGVVASPDPQVTSIWVFRTTDGGSQLEALPTNPYPNTTTTILDNAADSTLNPFQLPAISLQNTPPPPGIGGMVFHMGRMWGFVNNVLYYATGPDLGNILGNPYESWGPANFFTLPSGITKLIPTTVGLLVFTISDIYIVYGNGSAAAASTGVSGITVFYVAPFITGIGLLSQFAADVNGTTIYMFTADGQLLSLDPSSGVSEIGFPVGAPNLAYPNDPSLASFDPAAAYVTWHVSGSQDKALYVSDGSTGWFRCNTSQAPEGGFVWSPKANIVGGCKAVQSIETSPGVHQLLIGPGKLDLLTTPVLSSLAPVTGTIPAGTYYFVVTATDINGGETLVSNEMSITLTGVNNNAVVVSYSGDPRTVVFRIWFGTSPGGENQYFATVNPSVFIVNTLGGAASGTLPVSNTTGVGSIRVRNLKVFADNGFTYPANFTMGSIVLAYPGQMAELAFITCDYNKVGTSPSVSVLMDEISGSFSSLSGYVHSDPPQIYGTTSSPNTLYANRYDFQQSVAGQAPPPIYCRHLQILTDFGSTDGVRNELLSLTIFGSHFQEA